MIGGGGAGDTLQHWSAKCKAGGEKTVCNEEFRVSRFILRHGEWRVAECGEVMHWVLLVWSAREETPNKHMPDTPRSENYGNQPFTNCKGRFAFCSSPRSGSNHDLNVH